MDLKYAVLFAIFLFLDMKSAFTQKVETCDNAIDLAIIVDSSGSISRRNWRLMKEFVKQVVGKFEVSPDGTHVAGVVYSNRASVVLKFNTLQGAELNVDEVNKKFDEMKHFRRFTFIDKALLLANREVFTKKGGMRADKPKIALVITDGAQTIDRGDYTPLEEASQGLKDKGVIVYALGVSRSAQVADLIKIASSNDTVVRAPTFKGLDVVAKRIREDICEVAGVTTTTPIPTTVDPFPDCRDNITGCKCFVEAGECTTNPELPLMCARSCNACAQLASVKRRRARGVVPLEEIKAALLEKERLRKEREQTCGDFYVGCKCWKDEGFCTSNDDKWEDYMRKNCKISCGFCTPAV